MNWTSCHSVKKKFNFISFIYLKVSTDSHWAIWGGLKLSLFNLTRIKIEFLLLWVQNKLQFVKSKFAFVFFAHSLCARLFFLFYSVKRNTYIHTHTYTHTCCVGNPPCVCVDVMGDVYDERIVLLLREEKILAHSHQWHHPLILVSKDLFLSDSRMPF